MRAIVKPPRLRPGDAVAVVSPSWGGPAVFPHVYQAGLAVLRGLGLEVVELPHARADPAFVAAHPELRAADLHAAFDEPRVRAVIASIGGDDSIRVLPHLDVARALAQPKIVMGYSDTTTLLVTLAQAGLVTFHGPTVMAGLAQAPRLPPGYLEHLRAVLFDGAAPAYPPYGVFCEGYLDWATHSDEPAPLQPDGGMRILQGRGRARGRLFGGCLEVLDFLRGTRYWPAPAFLDGKLLFLETSEEAPPPAAVGRSLRSYGVGGHLDGVRGIVVGRPRGYSAEDKALLERVLVDVVTGEFGRADLPIAVNADFGHTDPQRLMPLLVEAELDCDAATLRLCEPAVQ